MQEFLEMPVRVLHSFPPAFHFHPVGHRYLQVDSAYRLACDTSLHQLARHAPLNHPSGWRKNKGNVSIINGCLRTCQQKTSALGEDKQQPRDHIFGLW